MVSVNITIGGMGKMGVASYDLPAVNFFSLALANCLKLSGEITG